MPNTLNLASPTGLTAPVSGWFAALGNTLLNTFLVAAFALAGASVGATGITLPPDVSKLRPSNLPGYALAQQKCGICHSADYISYQPPGLSLAQWTAEMNKMQHSYGAPLDRTEVALIGAYLAVAYGSAKAGDASVTKLTASHKAAEKAQGSKPAGDKGAVDVQALLTSNACLACHALQKAVVGQIQGRCGSPRLARQVDPPGRRRQMGPGGHAADGPAQRRTGQGAGRVCAEAVGWRGR
jgi:cytochrome c